MDPEALYITLGRLIQTMPSMASVFPLPPEQALWLGRANAIMAQLPISTDQLAFPHAMDTLMSSNLTAARWKAVYSIQSILYRALADAELKAPVKSQGAFIAAGNAFDALAALGKILGSATRSILIVDPYLDEKVLTDFAPSATESIEIKLLTDEHSVKPSLLPAVAAWRKQFKDARPLEVRLASPRSLHDRLIIADDSDVWILTQSLNALAARAPASIVRVEAEAAALKTAAYSTIWDGATKQL